MGNKQSQLKSDTWWKLVGRRSDVETICKKLCKGTRQINIVGMKKIGKTRVMVELVEKLEAKQNRSGRCFYVSCENISSDEDVLRKFIAKKSKELSKVMNDIDRGRQQGENLNSEVEFLIQKIQKFCEDEQNIILFLDNLDQLMDRRWKDIFLHFVSTTLKRCNNIKFVLAQSVKSGSTKSRFVEYELLPLKHDDILQLLFEIIENYDNEDDEVNYPCDREEHFHFDETMKVFFPENEPFLRPLAGLCEGLPLAAEVVGMMLKENNGLLSPKDMVEILVMERLGTLSPGNIAPEERLDQYKKEFEKLGEQLKNFANNLNTQITSCDFTLDEAMLAADRGTSAEVKMKIIKPFLDSCLLFAKKMGRDQQFHFHGVLRESQAILHAVEGMPSDEQTKNLVFKFMEENMKNAGLPFEETLLRDRKALELAIRSLQTSAATETAGPMGKEFNEDAKYQTTPRITVEDITYLRHNQETKEEVCYSSTRSSCGYTELELYHRLNVPTEGSKTCSQPPFCDAEQNALKKNQSGSSLASLSDDDVNSPFPTKSAGGCTCQSADTKMNSETRRKDLKVLQMPTATPQNEPTEENSQNPQRLNMHDFIFAQTMQRTNFERESESEVNETIRPREPTLRSNEFSGTGPPAMEYLQGGFPVQESAGENVRSDTPSLVNTSGMSFSDQPSAKQNLQPMTKPISCRNSSFPSISTGNHYNHSGMSKMTTPSNKTFDKKLFEQFLHDSQKDITVLPHELTTSPLAMNLLPHRQSGVQLRSLVYTGK